MKKLVSLPLLTALCLSGAVVNAGEYHTHAVACQPAYGTYGQIGYGEPGAANFSSTAELRAFCPVQQSENTVKISRASLAISDNSSTTPTWCYAWGSHWLGGTYWSSTKYSCSDPNGCADSTSSFTGHAFMYWANPFGTAWVTTMGYSCNIARSSGYASWINELWTNTTI